MAISFSTSTPSYYSSSVHADVRPTLPPLRTLGLPMPSSREGSPASSSSSSSSRASTPDSDSPNMPWSRQHPRHHHAHLARRYPSTSSTSSTRSSLSPPPRLTHPFTSSGSPTSAPTAPPGFGLRMRLRPVPTLEEANAAIVVAPPAAPRIPALQSVSVLASPSSSCAPTSKTARGVLAAIREEGEGEGQRPQVLLLVKSKEHDGLRYLKGPERRVPHGARVHPYRYEYVLVRHGQPGSAPASRKTSISFPSL